MLRQEYMDDIKKIHFVGIGGIGMSALARMMLHEGKVVSGSDLVETDLTKQLQKEGVLIVVGQKKEHVPDDIDVVVYTIAISNDNPELVRARELGVPIFTYSQMLGEVSKGNYTIAISGTHGKTTTTAMIADVLIDAGLSPIVIVGSLLSKYKSNFIPGKGNYFVVEVCEYKRSFHNIHPDILVITNIEEDHLDYYTDLTDIENAFADVVNKISSDGYVVCGKGKSVEEATKNIQAQKISYEDVLSEVPDLVVPGNHNRSNAAAALSVARILNVPNEQARQSLAKFEGTWRRIERKGEMKSGEIIYDDYAHHPTEIEATLETLKNQFPETHLRVIFQAHLYSRTKQMLREFAKSFTYADEVIVVPIFAAREKDDGTISQYLLAEEISKHHRATQAVDSFDKAEALVQDNPYPEGITLTMGAGDVYTIADKLVTNNNT